MFYTAGHKVFHIFNSVFHNLIFLPCRAAVCAGGRFGGALFGKAVCLSPDKKNSLSVPKKHETG